MDSKNSLFNAAAIPGLILGGISIAYLLLNWVLSKWGGAFAGAISFILSLAKIGACIYLFRALLLQYYKSNPQSDRRELYRLGRLYALLSALVYSAFYMAYMLFIEPEIFSQAFGELRKGGLMDAASLEMLDNLLPQMPTYTFFINLIYCYLFGVVLAAIFSRSIVPNNPFNQDQQ